MNEKYFAIFRENKKYFTKNYSEETIHELEQDKKNPKWGYLIDLEEANLTQTQKFGLMRLMNKANQEESEINISDLEFLLGIELNLEK